MRHATPIALASLLLTAACAGSEAPPVPLPPDQPLVDAQSSTDASPSTDAPKPQACADAEDCASQGSIALLRGDPETALPMLEYACTQGSSAGCHNLSTALRNDLTPANPEAAHAAAKRGCELGSGAACVDVGVDEYLGEGGVTQDFASASAHFETACEAKEAAGCRYLGVLLHEGQLASVDDAKALTYFEKACAMGDGPGCFNAGVMLAEGLAGSVDLQAAQDLMNRACQIGDESGCAAVEKIGAMIDAASSKVPDANLRIGSATVDGLTVNSLECRVDSGGGGLLGNMVLLGAIAKRKRAIDKCGKPGAEVEVTWSASKGKITKAEGEGTQGACVAKTLVKLATPVDGDCAASIVLGP